MQLKIPSFESWLGLAGDPPGAHPESSALAALELKGSQRSPVSGTGSQTNIRTRDVPNADRKSVV